MAVAGERLEEGDSAEAGDRFLEAFGKLLRDDGARVDGDFDAVQGKLAQSFGGGGEHEERGGLPATAAAAGEAHPGLTDDRLATPRLHFDPSGRPRLDCELCSLHRATL